MNSLLEKLPVIHGIHREIVELKESFELIAARFAMEPGTVVLLSGTDLDCSRYHFLAVKPWLTLSGKGEHHLVEYKGEQVLVSQDPFESLERILARYSIAQSDELNPVSAGLFGYFAYDLKDRIEKLPRTCVDQNLPDIYLNAPSMILVFDKKTDQATLCIPRLSVPGEEESADQRCQRIRKLFFETLSAFGDSESSRLPEREFLIDRSGFRSNFTKSSYLDTVETIIDYIKAGDIYQVNLSQRFEAGFEGDPYSLFLALFKKNPAPFFAYVNAGDHHIVSTSPERFIKRQGNYLETRPIKGTIQRGRNAVEDERLGRKLSESVKDDAELSMIVDLMRNDLGKVARGGTVRVKEHKRREPYDNVFHLVSIVDAELDTGKTSVDVIRATFPGGSITGCPKIRSMEIIDELEPVKRHVYTGSIGYLSFHDTMDLSIAIRTATVHGSIIGFSVGGGIVYDSDPEKEYAETLHKGKTLMDTLAAEEKTQNNTPKMAWVGGRIIPEDQAVVSAACPGFQYGAGLFETIRVEDGIPVFLNEHVERFNSGWERVFQQPPPDITWKDVIDLLIDHNNLTWGTAAVKLMAAMGDVGKPGSPDFIAAFARPYSHRLKTLGKIGIDLVTYPFPRQTPLADYKTLNYLYYYLAGRYAQSKNADEALVLNPDGTVSETNTCSIMAVKDRDVIVPESDHVLSGVTSGAALDILSGAGYRISGKRVAPKEFFSFGPVILTNALMGAVPVISLDNSRLEYSREVCALINSSL